MLHRAQRGGGNLTANWQTPAFAGLYKKSDRPHLRPVAQYDPTETRTPVAGMKSRNPRPLDDGAACIAAPSRKVPAGRITEPSSIPKSPKQAR